MKKKILIVTNRFVVGGPSIHIAMLAEGLQEDFEIMLLGGPGARGEITNLDIFKNINNEPIIIDELSKSFNPYNDYIAYKKIYRLIRKYKPDIIHTHTAKPGLIARLAARSLKSTKIIHTFHGHLFKGYFNCITTKFIVYIERYLTKFTDVIITLSESQQADIKNKYKIGKDNQHIIIPLAVNDKFLTENIELNRKKFRSDYKIQDDEIVIGIVGRLSKIKNIPFFIEAISKLKIKSNKTIKAFIIGDGPEKQELKHIAIREGIDYAEFSYGKRKADLIFTSWCRNIAKSMAGIDILALTSNNEGTPMSIIEAQMCGKAVVSFDVGGVKDIVKKDETAFLIPPKNKNEFVNKLFTLTENKDFRIEMGKKAMEFASENFTTKLFYKNYKKLYENL